MTKPAETKPLHIISLEAENIMRLRAVNITFENGVTLIGGRNMQGKSALFSAIEMALGGKKLIPPQPINTEARKGFSRVVLGRDGEPEITAKLSLLPGNRTKLDVHDATGGKLKSPQSVLTALAPHDSFDPLELMRKSDAEQAAKLREVSGVDTRQLDGQRQRFYDERTEKGRDLKRLEGQYESLEHHRDVPEREVSVTELAEQLECQREAIEHNKRLRAEAESAAADVDKTETRIGFAAKRIAQIEKELAEAKEELEAAEAAKLDAKLEAERAADAVANLIDPDLDEVRKQLHTAEDTNAKVRANAEREKVRKQIIETEGQRDVLTDAIRDIDDKKADMLARAKLPVPGLGFDGDLVLLNKLPLSQASQAEQLRVWIAVMFATNPRLRAVWSRDASRLDDDALRTMAEVAAEYDGQVLLERVGNRDPGAIIIEDGAVAEPAELKEAG